MRTTKGTVAATAVVFALALTAACGSSAASSGSATSTAAAARDSSNDATTDLAGPGCARYAERVPTGTGSVAGMAADPVAVAAGNNPLLTTLTATLSGRFNPRVNLVATLNGGDFTVFAPVDKAFAKLPKATLRRLASPRGATTLRKILTYHVVAGQMTPKEISGRTLRTVEGERLKISGRPGRLVAQKAHVICGGVRTANATVYLIDSVMMPPSMG